MRPSALGDSGFNGFLLGFQILCTLHGAGPYSRLSGQRPTREGKMNCKSAWFFFVCDRLRYTTPYLKCLAVGFHDPLQLFLAGSRRLRSIKERG